MTGFEGKVAAVTGAASGIGRALALGLGQRGAVLALADVDEPGLADTAAQVRAAGARVTTARVDVADREAVLAWAEQVAGELGVVHQVYNNAGIAGGGRTVLESGFDLYERTLGVNLWGVIHGTKAFLPHLVASGDGHVVNISSLNGYLAQPTLSAYCASKFAVRGFTETLRAELLADGLPVRATVVHPGGVRTNIVDANLRMAAELGYATTEEDEARSRFYRDKLLTMPPETAARIVLDGVAAGKPRILVGRDARAVDLLVRIAPRAYPALVVRAERRVAGLAQARRARQGRTPTPR